MIDDITKQSSLKQLRVAIVHYWFLGRAGGERVVEEIAKIFPQADVFTLIADKEVLDVSLPGRKVTVSWLQRIPGAKRFHRHLLALQPFALEQFDLSKYDLVISSESGPAKGVLTSPKCCHICYCHSPMRYLWDLSEQYTSQMGPLTKPAFLAIAHFMRVWDVASSSRVDFFIANSNFVKCRIAKYFRRESRVIHPPVETSRGWISNSPKEYYLTAGRLVPYKRIDLAVEACNRLGRQLIIAGHGPLFTTLRKRAGSMVKFVGNVSDEELFRLYANARALIFPGEDDFGIIPVEVQSCGRPVIAYGSGGALETVRGIWNPAEFYCGSTGVFFQRQTIDEVCRAIEEFESIESRFIPECIREHAMEFDTSVFRSRFISYVQSVMRQFAATLGAAGPTTNF
jgi:glycosyltransferase involved in cell wall biosynthesis